VPIVIDALSKDVQSNASTTTGGIETTSFEVPAKDPNRRRSIFEGEVLQLKMMREEAEKKEQEAAK
jgi:hypothetical protein